LSLRLLEVSEHQQLAEVIDLVQLPRRARPVPFAELDFDEVPGARAMDCGSYQQCLAFVANVKWRSFSCRRCPLRDADPEVEETIDDFPGASVIHLP